MMDMERGCTGIGGLVLTGSGGMVPGEGGRGTGNAVFGIVLFILHIDQCILG